MKSRRAVFLQIFAFLLLGLLVFTVSLWYQFPYGQLARKLETSLKNAGVVAKIEGLKAASFPSLRADSLTIKSVDGAPVPITFAPVMASVNLAGLLTGNIEINVTTATFGGRIDATLKLLEEKIEADFEGLALSSLAMAFPDDLPPLGGVAGGRAVMGREPGAPESLAGEVKATLANASIGPGKLRVANIPSIELGNATLSSTVVGRKIYLEELNFDGGEIEVNASGEVNFATTLRRSAIDLDLTLNPTGAGVEKKLPLVFGILSKYREADGSYSTKLRGPLTAPRLRDR